MASMATGITLTLIIIVFMALTVPITTRIMAVIILKVILV